MKDGTSAVLLQSGLDENWWADSLECYTCLRNVTRLWDKYVTIGRINQVENTELVGGIADKTADHKVLNEEGESRDSHRYAVVVQDLATQWIQFNPCKTKSAHETEKSLLKLLDRRKHGKWYLQTT